MHRLTARAVIRDWEDGTLDPDKTHHEAKKNEQKSYIISLSKQYSIVTTLTSFVAIEEREKVHIVCDPKYLFQRGNKPLLYHQIGNINFFIFITNQ